jgi:hypothetical protein
MGSIPRSVILPLKQGATPMAERQDDVAHPSAAEKAHKHLNRTEAFYE